ncbi:hypothetical protein D3C72_1969700 [compost metagenome]
MKAIFKIRKLITDEETDCLDVEEHFPKDRFGRKRSIELRKTYQKSSQTTHQKHHLGIDSSK